MDNSTIAAIATPLGSGGISIVRISGENAVAIAEQMFRSYNGKKVANLKGYSGTLGEIISGEKVLDQGIVTRFIPPKSYTGEDVIEISCHGGSWVTSQVLRLAFDLGAVPAEPGEFTKRAFLNGKMNLLEAESVMDIINAQGNAALNAANQIREGNLSTKIHEVVEKIISQSAHLAAWSDYPDEDMEMLDTKELRANLLEARVEVTKLIDSFDYGRILKEGIATAIVGKPNVGKSTLMNLLSGYETSIVSSTPGTTRDVVKESIRIGDLVLQLADTAGIRTSEDEIERVGVERAKVQIENASLILGIFDGSQQLDGNDIQLIELIKNKNIVILVNKSDLISSIDMDYLGENFGHIIMVSAKENSGVEKLEAIIKKVMNLDRFTGGDSLVVLNERQRQSLLKSGKSMSEALEALEAGVTLDAVSICLEDALDSLLSLTGQKVQDEIVAEVFANFCVGK